MTVLATIIVLGVLIFVHELGHFAAAKAVGIRVERFSIGLGPRILGFTQGETEYVLSAIPLGGYVKMGGMDDEVMERMEGGAATPREPSERDYDSKPVWARAMVISAGVFMNMVFAFVVYASLAAFWGGRTVDTTRVGEVNAAALPAGTSALARIPEGARFVRVGGAPVANWAEIGEALLSAPAGPIEVEVTDPRMELTVELPAGEEERLLMWRAVSYWSDPVIGEVSPGSPADEGGLQGGDRILAVDGVEVAHWTAMTRLVRARPEEPTAFRLERDGAELTRNVTPERVVETDPVTGERLEVGRAGVTQQLPAVTYRRVSVGEAIVAGWNETWRTTGRILAFLRDLVTGGVSPRSVGSIITIGQASGQMASLGLPFFLEFMALFSVNLAVLNLLPIPVLDGGHLVFLAIEAVRGKALSVEQRLRWSNVGFLVLMGIMVWALGNDILRVLGI